LRAAIDVLPCIVLLKIRKSKGGDPQITQIEGEGSGVGLCVKPATAPKVVLLLEEAPEVTGFNLWNLWNLWIDVFVLVSLEAVRSVENMCGGTGRAI